MPDLDASDASHSDTVEKIARLGYAVKGILYVLIGVLAVMAAFGGGGKTAGSRGAIKSVADAPFGNVLLWIVAAGLAAYALWRFTQAFLDPDDKGSDTEGIIKRIGYFISGLIHAGLTYWLVRGLLSSGDPGSGSGGSGSGIGSGGSSSGSSSSGGGASDWTATLMEQPFGPWLVGLVGGGVVAYGLYQLYKAATVDFSDKFKTDEMSETEKKVARVAGQAGLSARGVVFGLMGGFLIYAALTANPSEAKGLGGALDTLAAQPFGPYLLAAVAFGLAAYGVYCGVNARYRKIPSD